MNTWRKRTSLFIGGFAVIVAGSVAAAALASTTTSRHATVRMAPKAMHTLSAHERAALLRRAVRFRTLARELILQRNTALHGRHLSAVAAPDPVALAAIRDMAIEMASLNGDPHPQNGQVFASTRKFAEGVISGDIVDTDQPVYVAVFHGNFIGYMASVPNSGDFPLGNTMTVVFDANSLAVTDWGLVSNTPDTTWLGQATSIGF